MEIEQRTQELLAVEGLEALENAEADAASSEGSDNLALEVEGALGDGGNLPVAAGDLLVRRDKVAHEDQDRHDHVLRDRDDVAGGRGGSQFKIRPEPGTADSPAGDLGDGDLLLVRGVQVDVVRADTSGDSDLELLRLLDHLAREVARVERGGDEDFGIDNVLRELGVRALLVRGDDELDVVLLAVVGEAQGVLGLWEGGGSA